MSGEFWFDEAAAETACQWIERNCVFSADRWASKPFRLEAWQRDDIVRPLFGWKRKDGTRRYRRCIVWVPRKNGKTELAAAIGLTGLLATGIVGGEGYSIARDRDQAKIVFERASRMAAWSPSLSGVCEVLKTSVFVPELQAAFKPLSGRPEGKHGLNASLVIGDEVHEWPDDRLYTFVHQSTAARREPIEFLISTAGTREGYGFELWQHCQRVLAGEADDPETLVVIYAAAPEDDWTAPETWAKANPNLGVSVTREYLAAECARAQENPRLENDFKRYHLNIFTEQAVRWLNIETWDRCNRAGADHWRELEDRLAGRVCFGGIDLSATTDLTALALWFPPTGDDPLAHVLVRFWMPGDRVEQRARRDRAPYRQWIESGALNVTEGNAVDYRALQAQAYADAERFQIRQIGFDPWNATQTTIEMADEGLPMVQVRQGYRTLSPPSKELERLVVKAGFNHGGQPVLRWNAQNVAITSDPAGNIKPAKDKSTDRIDGIAATVTALGLAMAEETEPMSYTAQHGLMVA